MLIPEVDEASQESKSVSQVNMNDYAKNILYQMIVEGDFWIDHGLYKKMNGEVFERVFWEKIDDQCWENKCGGVAEDYHDLVEDTVHENEDLL